MATVDDLLQRLQDVNFDQYDRVEKATLRKALALWVASPNYRDADVKSLAAQLIPLIQQAQLSAARVEATFIAKAHTAATGEKLAASRVDRALITGTVYDWDDRLTHPAIVLRTELSKGASMSDAIERGGNALTRIVRKSLAEAKSAQAGASFKDAGVEKYQRVLSGTACDFCIRVIGSGRQEYSVGSGLRPLHDSCNCGYRAVRTGRMLTASKPTTAEAQARAAKTSDLKARKANPEKQRAHLRQTLARFESEAAAIRDKWGDIESLSIEKRRLARRAIGIAEQRVKGARKALA